jgi:hypothetical protein
MGAERNGKGRGKEQDFFGAKKSVSRLGVLHNLARLPRVLQTAGQTAGNFFSTPTRFFFFP